MSQTVYTADLTVYDPTLGTTRVLRYATCGFVTGTGDVPASTHYDARILQPAVLSRTAFSAATTMGRSRVGYGDLVLTNEDGELDPLLTYGFDGRAITMRRGTLSAAFPAGFTTYLVATMEQPEATTNTIVIKLRDRQAELDVPLQTTLYAGDNVLPDGLEGGAELAGKPKPICLGTVKNISPPCVNSSKLIYQVSDGAVSTIGPVYDGGRWLGYGLEKWTVRLTGATAVRGILCLRYGHGTLVAAGVGGEVYTSGDGLTWTLRASGTAQNIWALATDGVGTWLLCDQAGAAFQSTDDGTTWTAAAAVGIGARGAGFGNGIWLVTGTAGALSTSTDRIHWTGRVSSFGASDIHSQNVLYTTLANGKTYYICGGDDGKIAYSVDAINWTQASVTNFGTSAVTGFGYCRGILVATGTSGAVATSTDADIWTQRVSGFGTATVEMVEALDSGEIIVVGGIPTSFGLACSTDLGATWTYRTVNASYLGVRGLTSGFGMAIVGGYLGVGGPAIIVSSEAAAGTYASISQLQDDALAPTPGTYKVYLPGGYFRLGVPPSGAITADVTQGAAAANRTAAQLANAVAIGKGVSFNAGDIAALDGVNSSVLGDWSAESTTASARLDRILGSVGAWWGVDAAGDFRMKQFVAPSGAAVAAFTANDLLRPLERITSNDPGRGVPVYRETVRHTRNFTVQTTDLAGGVTDDRRAWLAQEWREATATDAAIQTEHPLAVTLVEESLLTAAADAQAEADRRLTLRKRHRDFFRLVVPLDATTAAIDLGNVVSLEHARYGLTPARLFVVLGIEPDLAGERIAFTIWGPNDGLYILTDGALDLVTDTGAYLIEGEG